MADSLAGSHGEPPSSPRDAAVWIVRVLRGAGHAAYLAGGCVRDELLGYHPKDYDVATDAHPDRVRELFHNSRYIGEAFGVVQVRIGGGPGQPGHTVEVATFRSEWGYEDGRRPGKVHFTDAQHDAQRRDFTINGLFEDPLADGDTGKVIDFVGGQDDLRAKLIRAIGDPRERFAEDYLRMLRAVRFATRLGFEIEPSTAGAVREYAPKLAQISRERVGQELMWMLTPAVPPDAAGVEHTGVDRRSADAVRLIQELHLDSPVLDEPHVEVALPTVAAMANAAGRQPVGYPTVLAAWMIDRHVVGGGLPKDVDALTNAVKMFLENEWAGVLRRWRDALCLSNDHRDALRGVVELVPAVLGWPGLPVARRKRLLARPLWKQVFALVGAMAGVPGVKGLIATIGGESADLFNQGVCPEPWVNGNDLIAMGLQPGPVFSRLLEEVYDAQLDGRVTTPGQALQWVRQRHEANP